MGTLIIIILLTGVTPSSSTGQFTPINSASPNHSASYLSPERANQSSSAPVGSSPGHNVSWAIGGAEGVNGRGNTDTTDSVTLEPGMSCQLFVKL